MKFSNEACFALYRLPQEEKIQAIVSSSSELKKVPIKEVSKRHGFVVSEFLSDGFCYLIEGNYFETINLNETYLSIDNEHLENYLEISQSDYFKLARTYINSFSKDFKKAILSRTKQVRLADDFSPLKAFQALEQKYSNAFVYLQYSPQFGMWMGATPEVLLTQDAIGFQTVSLAGSQPYNSEGLIWQDKEIVEQQIVTDYIANILKANNVNHTMQGPQTIQAGKVAHLKTVFNLEAGFQVGELVHALHPTPAVCGMPRDAAMRFIVGNEGYNRSLYTGFVGVVQEKLNLFVNLRCAQLFKNQALIYVGGGLTKDSIPEKEWQETELKAQTMLDVLAQ